MQQWGQAQMTNAHRDCCYDLELFSQPSWGQDGKAKTGTEARLRCAGQVRTSPKWLDEAPNHESWEKEMKLPQDSGIYDNEGRCTP